MSICFVCQSDFSGESRSNATAVTRVTCGKCGYNEVCSVCVLTYEETRTNNETVFPKCMKCGECWDIPGYVHDVCEKNIRTKKSTILKNKLVGVIKRRLADCTKSREDALIAAEASSREYNHIVRGCTVVPNRDYAINHIKIAEKIVKYKYETCHYITLMNLIIGIKINIVMSVGRSPFIDFGVKFSLRDDNADSISKICSDYERSKIEIDKKLEKLKQETESPIEKYLLESLLNGSFGQDLFEVYIRSYFNNSGVPRQDSLTELTVSSIREGCSRTDCRGFLSGNSYERRECEICKVSVCPKCLSETHPSTNGGDSCDPAILESIAEIERSSVCCPRCGVRIAKSEGCNDMFCVMCKTCFNYRTLEVDKSGNSNPLYFEWKNERSVVSSVAIGAPYADSFDSAAEIPYMSDADKLRMKKFTYFVQRFDVMRLGSSSCMKADAICFCKFLMFSIQCLGVIFNNLTSLSVISRLFDRDEIAKELRILRLLHLLGPRGDTESIYNFSLAAHSTLVVFEKIKDEFLATASNVISFIEDRLSQIFDERNYEIVYLPGFPKLSDYFNSESFPFVDKIDSEFEKFAERAAVYMNIFQEFGLVYQISNSPFRVKPSENFSYSSNPPRRSLIGVSERPFLCKFDGYLNLENWKDLGSAFLDIPIDSNKTLEWIFDNTSANPLRKYCFNEVAFAKFFLANKSDFSGYNNGSSISLRLCHSHPSIDTATRTMVSAFTDVRIEFFYKNYAPFKKVVSAQENFYARSVTDYYGSLQE